MSEIEKKAIRRIRRFIQAESHQVVRTDNHQARVYQIGKRIYEYKVKHHVRSLFFKRTIFGRLKKITLN